VAISLSDSFCVERHRNDFLDLVNGEVDLVFANSDEAMALFKASSIEHAIDAFEETGLLAAITRGADGCIIVTPAGTLEVPASPLGDVVDTNGAGDLFAAGFLYGLTNGLDPESSAKLAGLCAGEVITHLGARPQANLRELAQAHGLLDD